MDNERRRVIHNAYRDALENHGMSVAAIGRATGIPSPALSQFNKRGGMMGFERLCVLARFLQEHGILPLEFDAQIPRSLTGSPPTAQERGGREDTQTGALDGIELTLLELIGKASALGATDVLSDLGKLSNELLSLNRQMQVIRARIAEARERLESRQPG